MTGRQYIYFSKKYSHLYIKPILVAEGKRETLKQYNYIDYNRFKKVFGKSLQTYAPNSPLSLIYRSCNKINGNYKYNLYIETYNHKDTKHLIKDMSIFLEGYVYNIILNYRFYIIAATRPNTNNSKTLSHYISRSKHYNYEKNNEEGFLDKLFSIYPEPLSSERLIERIYNSYSRAFLEDSL